MIIAVDFDGTIANPASDYSIVDEVPGAIDALRQLRAAGHQLVLWTCRGPSQGLGGYENAVLGLALDWLADRGFEFKYVNENPKPLGKSGHLPRKVFAHIYIDDRNFGGFPGWDKVLEELL